MAAVAEHLTGSTVECAVRTGRRFFRNRLDKA
jgi:hypothetical protein